MEQLFVYNREEQRVLQQTKPWLKDPQYFKRVRISALALLKMAMHAKSGGTIEVMGMLQGKIMGDTFVVIDTFPLPVEGTETRVNAGAEAYEYTVQFMSTSERVGRQENAVGWYHSHPSYGCWLSGIDVNTQVEHQKYQEPFLAIVVDPIRTEAAGRVEIGAFRTYPPDYVVPEDDRSDYQSIPLNKIEDFGVHAKRYYKLEVSFFKSKLDAKILDVLWAKHWVSTLAANPILSSANFISEQLTDLTQKLDPGKNQNGGGFGGGASGPAGGGGGNTSNSNSNKGSEKMDRVIKDAQKIALEFSKAAVNQQLREALF